METYNSSFTAQDLENAIISSIKISGAKPGQTVAITAVDDNGVPTAWEPADFAGGGSAVLLVDFTTTEDVASVNVPSNDTESEFSELFFEIYALSSGQNTGFKPIYISMAGATAWAMNASQNVEGRPAMIFGYLDLRLPNATGYIRTACPVNNGLINTGVTWNTNLMYGGSHDNTCKDINFSTQNQANIMKAGTWVKVWGIKK